MTNIIHEFFEAFGFFFVIGIFSMIPAFLIAWWYSDHILNYIVNAMVKKITYIISHNK